MKLRAVFAELVATFFFIFAGVLSAYVAATKGGELGSLLPALAHGLALAILVSATMHISGGQVNPAVTIGVWLGNQINLRQALANIFAQIVGAMLAIQALIFSFGRDTLETTINFGTPTPGTAIMRNPAMLLEGLFTGLLVFVVLATAVDRRAHKMAGLFIGGTVTLAALTIGPFTGACINPARYLGPALTAGGIHEWKIYLASPIIGGAVAALIYTYYLGREDKLDPSAGGETPGG